MWRSSRLHKNKCDFFQIKSTMYAYLTTFIYNARTCDYRCLIQESIVNRKVNNLGMVRKNPKWLPNHLSLACMSDHSRNNNVLFLPTLAADVQLKRAGLTDDVIRILHCLLRALDTERRKHACSWVVAVHVPSCNGLNVCSTKVYSPFFGLCQCFVFVVLHFPLKNILTTLTEPIMDFWLCLL